MTDIYDAENCHNIAIELDSSRFRYFERLSAAADTLCFIQDGIASIPVDLAKGRSLYPLGKRNIGDPQASPQEMVEHIVREAFGGHYYLEGHWSTAHSSSPTNKPVMQDYRPSQEVVANLTLAGCKALEQLASDTVARLVEAFGPEILADHKNQPAKNGAVA